MMQSIAGWMLFLWIGLTCVSCTSAELCPPTDRQQAWSKACFAEEGGTRHVKPAHIKQIKGNAAGITTIMITDPPELVAVDRTGVVIIPHIVHTGDFDFPGASAGLARFENHPGKVNGKPAQCGYFDSSTFKVIIAPIYDHCMAAESGTATVCVGCAIYCREPDCQSRTFVGGHGFVVDKHNKVVRRFTPPSLDKACGGTAGKLVARSDRPPYLECPAPSTGPFSKLR